MSSRQIQVLNGNKVTSTQEKLHMKTEATTVTEICDLRSHNNVTVYQMLEEPIGKNCQSFNFEFFNTCQNYKLDFAV